MKIMLISMSLQPVWERKSIPEDPTIQRTGMSGKGPLDDLLETSEEILRGGEPDNGLLPFICKLNKKEDVHDEANWPMANPSLPYLPNLLEEIRKEYRDWKKNPDRLPAFMTKRMNIPDSSSEIKVTEWENIMITKRELIDLARWSCTCGIDYSKITDFASVNLHFRDGDLRYDINHSWLCLQSKDIPRMKCPWKEWAKDGHLTLVDDVEIHPSYLTDYITEMKRQYDIRHLALDDFRYALLSNALREIGFDAKTYKNIKLVRPMDIMRVATVIDSCFTNHWFIWGDNPPLRWATNNTKLIRAERKPGMRMMRIWETSFMER